jgi:hypothetical protein
MITDRRAQLREFRVMKRSSKDLEGTQFGSRRMRDTFLSVCTRCCSSKWRRYFCTTLGIVIRSAAAKFCIAMDRCLSESCSS